MGGPGALPSCAGVLQGGGLSRGRPLALSRKPGKGFMGGQPAGVCLPGHPGLAGGWLPGAYGRACSP